MKGTFLSFVTNVTGANNRALRIINVFFLITSTTRERVKIKTSRHLISSLTSYNFSWISSRYGGSNVQVGLQRSFNFDAFTHTCVINMTVWNIQYHKNCCATIFRRFYFYSICKHNTSIAPETPCTRAAPSRKGRYLQSTGNYSIV